MEQSQSDGNNTKYEFWFWSHKFDAILLMITKIINYELLDVETEVIKEALENTNDEKGIWYSHELVGKETTLNIELAYDAEEGKDMIHIKTPSNGDLRIKLETLNLFQSMFDKLE